MNILPANNKFKSIESEWLANCQPQLIQLGISELFEKAKEGIINTLGYISCFLQQQQNIWILVLIPQWI